MSGRANELRQLLDGLLSGSAPERDEARSIGMALRGSGSTFGFPEVSDAAALVESARDEDLLRRVEGLIGQLGALSGQSEDGTNEPTIALPPEWLVRAAGLGDTLHPSWAADGGWTPLARSAGIDLTELARRAADYLGIDVADLADRRPSALRLVPEAFVTSAEMA